MDPSVSCTAVTAPQTESVSYAAVAAPETPRVSENKLLPPCAYHNEYFLSSVKREHFHPDGFQQELPLSCSHPRSNSFLPLLWKVLSTSLS